MSRTLHVIGTLFLWPINAVLLGAIAGILWLIWKIIAH